jgi:hypothetical protein
MFLFATTAFKADIGPTQTLIQLPGFFQWESEGWNDEACRLSEYNAESTVHFLFSTVLFPFLAEQKMGMKSRGS